MQYELKCQASFYVKYIYVKVILVRTDSNLCRKELTVHWSAPNSLIMFYLQPYTNSMWGDESEAVAPIIWLYQTVDAQKEEVSLPDLLITLRRYAHPMFVFLRLTFVHSIYFCKETLNFTKAI